MYLDSQHKIVVLASTLEFTRKLHVMVRNVFYLCSAFTRLGIFDFRALYCIPRNLNCPVFVYCISFGRAHKVYYCSMYSWSSYANWRFHVLEVYMKMGDDKGALAFASKKSNHQAFGLGSSASAWLWSVALLNFRYKHQRGFAKEFYENVHELGSVFPPPGAIMCACQASYHVLSFLTSERQLPNYKIPLVMRSENSLSNAAVYCTSNLELWRSTPGAIEWAAKNCHTHYCFLLLRKEKEILDFLKFEQSLATFQSFVKKGIYLDSEFPGFEGGLVTEAVKSNMVPELGVLLKAGAKAVVSHGRCIPQALHMACYYDHDPRIIKLLCKYGKFLCN